MYVLPGLPLIRRGFEQTPQTLDSTAKVGPQTLINDQNLLLWTDDQINNKKHLDARAVKTGNIDNKQNHS